MGEGLGDGEEDDEDRAGDGDRAEDQQEVAATDVAPPLLVQAEGGEDGQLADDDDANGLREQDLVAVRQPVRIVEEAQLESQVEGQRDQHGVGRHLQNPVAIDGVVQPAHGTLAGIFLLMAAGSACIPIPSEAVMLFAGFSVSNGDQTLIGVALAGLAGNMAGSWLTYAIGYYGRVDLLEKNRLIHLSPSRLAWVDNWFKRHGDATVFFARLLPLVRAFISLPAGVAEMPFWRFTWLTALGSLPWVLGFALVGRAVGDNWENWRHHLQVLDYLVVAAIVGLIAYAVVRRRRGNGDEESTATAEHTGTPVG